LKIVQKLGFSSDTKLLIIHADDAGLCHSENIATLQALQNGSINSCSIMPPCPWFYEMVQFANENPQFDCGIHLTLTCEWQTYKWGPVADLEKVPSLLDENGFFHGKRNVFVSKCVLSEVEIELRAQIEKALHLGLQATHLDCHMFTLGLNQELKKLYQKLGKEYNLPVLLHEKLISDFGSNPKKILKPEDFCVDAVFYGDFIDFEKNTLIDFYGNVLDTMQSGLNIILIHPAFDNEEMQAVAIDHPNFGSEWRQMDFDFFTSETCKEKLKSNNIQLITWREIKEILYPKSIV
jgi:hypothetical protein